MLQTGEQTPSFTLSLLDGGKWRYPGDAGQQPVLLVFFATDCPTCQLTLPYLNRLAEGKGEMYSPF